MEKSKLIQLIHVGRSKLGMDEDTYRQMLQGLTGTASTSAMTAPQLSVVLDSMKKKGFRVMPAAGAKRTTLTSDPQSKKIRALWLTLADIGAVRDRSEGGLSRWVKRETGVSDLKWLNDAQAGLCIEKLKQWLRRVNKKEAL